MANGKETGRCRVLVVEQDDHPALGEVIKAIGGVPEISVFAADTVPVNLQDYDVLVLNNLTIGNEFPQGSVVRHAQNGHGVLCIHDTLLPSQHNQSLLAAMGVRYAFEAISVGQHEGQTLNTFHVAIGTPDDPSLCFPVRVSPENFKHPIVSIMEDFEIGEEF